MVRIHGHNIPRIPLRHNSYSYSQTSIFNVNNYFGCGGGCGCTGGGFWNSFATGLGMGFGRLFGGFSGMFSGFGMGMPMFGGYGMGMPMFGGWNNWWSDLGNIGSRQKSKTTSSDCNCKCCKDKKTSKTEKEEDGADDKKAKTTTTSSLDKDNPKIEKYSKGLDTTYPNGVTSQTDYDKEIEAIKKLASELDSVQDDSNKQWLKDLLDKLNNKAGDNIEIITNIESILDGAAPIKKTKQPEKPTDANWSNIPGLTDAQKLELEKAGVKPVQIGNDWMVTLPSPMNKANLQLLANAGVNVAVANNGGDKIVDHWIAGKISNVTEDSNGKLGYTIDCSTNNSAKYKFQYDVKQNSNDNKWTISYKSGYTEDCEDILYHKAQPDYEYKDGKLVKNGEPVITQYETAGYTELE